MLGSIGTLVGLISVASPPSGSDASGVSEGFHEGGLILGAVGVPLLAGGLALKGDRKLDMETSWKISDTSVPKTAVEVPVQQYEKFKAGLGFGLALSPGDATSGTLVTLEPAYRANSNVSFGLRLDFPSLGNNTPVYVSPTYCSPGPCPAPQTPTDQRGAPNVSYTVNGQYYFAGAKFTPFVGAGLGVFTFSSGSKQFGFYPRVGFDVSHFSLSLDYNFVPYFSYDYLGLRVGFFVGGGVKKVTSK